jgi:hypothetical protein
MYAYFKQPQLLLDWDVAGQMAANDWKKPTAFIFTGP